MRPLRFSMTERFPDSIIDFRNEEKCIISTKTSHQILKVEFIKSYLAGPKTQAIFTGGTRQACQLRPVFLRRGEKVVAAALPECALLIEFCLF